QAGDEAAGEEGEASSRDGRRAHVVLDTSYGRSRFERVGEFGDFVLHRSIDAPGRAWIASGTIGVADAAAALEATIAGDFDPRRQVVIPGAASTPPSAGKFELEHENADSLGATYRARCDAPAYLVLAQPHYPGWKARVNGMEVELLRANYAFSA